MAQGLGFIEFATGDVLSAAAANGYLASQTVMVFASAAARTSAIATPYEGMFSYLKDTNATEYYSGSAWVALGGGGAAAFKGAWIYNNATVGVSNVTGTTLTYNSEYYDTDSFHSTSVNTDRLTIPTTGYYLVTASVYWAANAVGAREMQLQKNGTTIREANNAGSTVGEVQTISNISYFTAADYITLRVYQDSGGSVNSQSGTTQGLQIAYMGA
jgi:hypothetical protein